MPEVVIQIPREFFSSMKQFTRQMEKVQELTSKIAKVQAQAIQALATPTKAAQPGQSQHHHHHAMALGFMRQFPSALRRFEMRLRRNIDHLVMLMGPKSRTFINMIVIPEHIFASIKSITNTASMAGLMRLGGRFFGVPGIVITVAKWIWDKAVQLMDWTTRDQIRALVTGTTVGGLRAFRSIFFMYDDPMLESVISRIRFAASDAQSLAMYGTLGVKRTLDTTNMIIDALRRARLFLKKFPGQEIGAARAFGLSFSDETIMKLLTDDPEKFEQYVRLLQATRGRLEQSDKSLDEIQALQELRRKLWSSIVNEFLKFLVSSGLADALTTLSNNLKAWLDRWLRTFRLVRRIKRAIFNNLFSTKWMKDLNQYMQDKAKSFRDQLSRLTSRVGDFSLISQALAETGPTGIRARVAAARARAERVRIERAKTESGSGSRAGTRGPRGPGTRGDGTPKKPEPEPVPPNQGLGVVGGGTANVPSGASANWNNYLAGLSYLETTYRNLPAFAGHSAHGYFQFQPQTIKEMADKYGIPDPTQGDYAQQANRTMQVIKKINPAAAAAIERGDFETANRLLKGRWPSLPGGSQPQPRNYPTFRDIIQGKGPRPPSEVGGGAPSTRPLTPRELGLEKPPPEEEKPAPSPYLPPAPAPTAERTFIPPTIPSGMGPIIIQQLRQNGVTLPSAVESKISKGEQLTAGDLQSIPKDDLEKTNKFVTGAGYPALYKDEPGRQKTILFLHGQTSKYEGMGKTRAQLEEDVRKYEKLGYKVEILDASGDNVAAQTAAARERLKKGDVDIVIGFSAGAHSADTLRKEFPGLQYIITGNPKVEGNIEIPGVKHMDLPGALGDYPKAAAPSPAVTGLPNGKLPDLPQVPVPGLDSKHFNPGPVNFKLRQIMSAAKTQFEALHPGYTVYGRSGHRTSNDPHGRDNALDVRIYDPNGKEIYPYGKDSTGLYTELARIAYGEQRARYPELNTKFNWGGFFNASGGPGTANPATGANRSDLEHFDVEGDRANRIGIGNLLHQLGVYPGLKYGETPQEALKKEKEDLLKPSPGDPFTHVLLRKRLKQLKEQQEEEKEEEPKKLDRSKSPVFKKSEADPPQHPGDKGDKLTHPAMKNIKTDNLSDAKVQVAYHGTAGSNLADTMSASPQQFIFGQSGEVIPMWDPRYKFKIPEQPYPNIGEAPYMGIDLSGRYATHSHEKVDIENALIWGTHPSDIPIMSQTIKERDVAPQSIVRRHPLPPAPPGAGGGGAKSNVGLGVLGTVPGGAGDQERDYGYPTRQDAPGTQPKWKTVHRPALPEELGGIGAPWKPGTKSQRRVQFELEQREKLEEIKRARKATDDLIKNLRNLPRGGKGYHGPDLPVPTLNSGQRFTDLPPTLSTPNPDSQSTTNQSLNMERYSGFRESENIERSQGHPPGLLGRHGAHRSLKDMEREARDLAVQNKKARRPLPSDPADPIAQDLGIDVLEQMRAKRIEKYKNAPPTDEWGRPLPPSAPTS